MNQISHEQWLRIFPNALPIIREQVNDLLIPKASLCTNNRLVFCLAQFAHETDGFRVFEERGRYEYFIRYDFNKSLGNTEKGDGYRFRGRGMPMITGRWNYTEFANSLKEPLTDDFIASLVLPERATRAGIWFWNLRHCNAACDEGNFEKVTRLINGGLTGYASRKGWRQRIERELVQ